jgi:hypothetical protein
MRGCQRYAGQALLARRLGVNNAPSRRRQQSAEIPALARGFRVELPPVQGRHQVGTGAVQRTGIYLGALTELHQVQLGHVSRLVACASSAHPAIIRQCLLS